MPAEQLLKAIVDVVYHVRSVYFLRRCLDFLHVDYVIDFLLLLRQEVFVILEFFLVVP